MSESRISVDVADFGIGSKAGLRKAAELAFRRVELATVTGETAPSTLTGSGRRHLSRFVDGLGLRLDVLTADVPGLRFTDPQTADERVVRTCEILQLAADLKVPPAPTDLPYSHRPELRGCDNRSRLPRICR